MKRNIKKEIQELKFQDLTVYTLSYLALFIAVVALATLIKVPGINTSYYNLGEVFIFTIAIVFGKKAGAISGALGSALIDLILAPIWAPFTLIIKGIEGWAIGSIAEKGKLSSKILAVVIGSHIMITGYALSVWCLYGWPSVLPEIIGNYGQAIVGLIIALPLTGKIDQILR